MKGRMPISIVLTLMLTTADFLISSNWQSAAILSAAESEGSYAPSFIVEAQGWVELKREQWSDYHRIDPDDTELYPGDLLRAAPRTRVRILCADERIFWTPPADEEAWGINNFCRPIPATRRSSSAPARGGDEKPGIPYIISPRNTRLLSEKPVLRWNGITDVGSYTVSISDQRANGQVIWETEVSGTEVVYAGQTPLEPGVPYLLIVKADNGSSSQKNKVPGRGFKLIDRNEAEGVRAAASKIEKELAGEAEALAIAHIYMERELRAEAIETLEKLVAKKSQTPGVYRLLGELYSQVGLTRLAGKRYLKAMELTAPWDVEGKAETQAALAEVYVGLGDTSEAIRYGEAAKVGYETLGDRARAGELADKLQLWRQLN